MSPAGWLSSTTSSGSPTTTPSRAISPRFEEPSGWSTPSARSGGPEAVLAYLARYTHRVAIANSRLTNLDEKGVTFRWKDYRARDTATGKEWIKTMTLPAEEFLRAIPPPCSARWFPPHPPLRPSRQWPARRQHRSHQKPDRRGRDRSDIRNRGRSHFIRHGRTPLVPCCGGRMRIVETFVRGQTPRSWPSFRSRIDTS